jgi:PKHD-type hydroxylase
MDTTSSRPFPSILPNFLKPGFNQHHFYHYTGGFTPEECDRIIESFSPCCTSIATTFGGDGNLKTGGGRSTRVKWIPYNDTTKWIYDKLIHYGSDANLNMFRLNISTLIDEIQFGLYDSQEHGCYGGHVDVGINIHACRKLSMCVQLSDPSDYSGGDLILKTQNLAPRGRGEIVIFPSNLHHEVTRVTSGKRYSLVLWLYGPPFV